MNDKHVIDELLHAIYSYLLSNTEISASEGIEIHCTVVGQKHATALIKQRQFNKIGAYQATSKKSKKMKNFAYLVLDKKGNSLKKHKHLFIVPNGIGDGPLSHIFFNSCLVISFTIGYLLRYAHGQKRAAQKQSILKSLNRLHSSLFVRQRKSVDFIMEWAFKLLSETSVPYKGPHSMTKLNELCLAHGCSTWVFSRTAGNNLIYRFPEEYNPHLKPIFLFHTKTFDRQVDHFHVIKSLRFFKQSIPCVQCGIPKPISNHKCQSKIRSQCKACNRLLLHRKDYYDSDLESLFCRSACKPDLKPYLCPNCNKKITETSCQKNHVKTCRQFVECLDCGQLVRSVARNKNKTVEETTAFSSAENSTDQEQPKQLQGHQPLSAQERLKGHICFSSTCRLCHSYLSPEQTLAFSKGLPGKGRTWQDHQCSLRIPANEAYVPTLVIYDIESVCDPITKEHTPNLLVAFFESNKHGFWHGIAFSAEGIDHPWKENIQPYVLEFPYLPKDFPQELVTRNAASSFFKPNYSLQPGHSYDPHENVKKVENDTDIEAMKMHYMNAFHENLSQFDYVDKEMKKNVVFRMLMFFIAKTFVNARFLAQYSSRYDNQFVLSTLLSLNFAPDALHSGQSILSIQIKEYNQVFLDAWKFLGESLSNLCSRFGLEESKGFFPMSWNAPAYYNYKNGPFPPLEAFVNENDTDKIIAQKKAFHQRAIEEKRSYSLVQELVSYCIQDCRVLALCVSHFLIHCYDLQVKFEKKFGCFAGPNKLPYFSPFHSCVTLGAFRYVYN